MDGDVLGGDARRFQLRAVGRPKIEKESAAAAAADELAGKLRRDLSAHFVAAGSDRGAQPSAEAVGVSPSATGGTPPPRRFSRSRASEVDDSDGPPRRPDDRNAVSPFARSGRRRAGAWRSASHSPASWTSPLAGVWRIATARLPWICVARTSGIPSRPSAAANRRPRKPVGEGSPSGAAPRPENAITIPAGAPTGRKTGTPSFVSSSQSLAATEAL